MNSDPLLISPEELEHPPAERRWLVAALVFLTGVAAVLRSVGLDPPSLWLDDQWVAMVVRQMDWGQYFALRPPVPVGFVAVESAIAWVFSDPEWPLQIVPWLAALAVVPLLSVLVTRWTGWRSLGLLAATLWVVSPMVSIYAVAVKPFASDALITVVLLLIGTPLLREWQARRGRWLVATALVATLFSFPSVLVAVPLVHLAALHAVVARRMSGRPVGGPLVTLVLYDLGLVAIYFLLLGSHAAPTLTDYWDGYMNASHLPRLVLGALSANAGSWSAVIPLVGIGVLLSRNDTFTLGMFAVAFYVGLVAVAYLGLYPLGGGRTDLFGHPLTLLLYLVPVAELRRWPALRDGGALAVMFAAAVILVGGASFSRYGEQAYRRGACADARLVTKLATNLRDDDALVIYPHGVFAVGYYGPWPVQLTRSGHYAHGFDVSLARPLTLVVPGYADLDSGAGSFTRDVRRFLEATGPERLGYYSSFAIAEVDDWVDRHVREQGYTPVIVASEPVARLRIYERPPLGVPEER